MKKSTKSFKKLLREIVGSNIRKARKKKGLKQIELSKLVNITKQQLSYYETAYNLPPLDVVIILSKALDCSVSDIYTPEKLDSLKYVFDVEEKPLIDLEGGGINKKSLS